MSNSTSSSHSSSSPAASPALPPPADSDNESVISASNNGDGSTTDGYSEGDSIAVESNAELSDNDADEEVEELPVQVNFESLTVLLTWF